MIRLHKQIDSERLYLPELRPLIGKVVEIIIHEVPLSIHSPYASFLALAGKDVMGYFPFLAIAFFARVGDMATG